MWTSVATAPTTSYPSWENSISVPLRCLARLAELEGLVSCVVDLHGLGFIDCAGLRALAHLSQELTARGGRLVVIRPQGHVARVFDLVGPADWEWASRAGGRCLLWSSQRPDANVPWRG